MDFSVLPLRASLGMFSGSGRDTQGKAKLIYGSVSQSLLVSHLLALPWLKVIYMGPNQGEACGARAGRNCMAKALDLSRGKELEMGLQSTSQKQAKLYAKVLQIGILKRRQRPVVYQEQSHAF